MEFPVKQYYIQMNGGPWRFFQIFFTFHFIICLENFTLPKETIGHLRTSWKRPMVVLLEIERTLRLINSGTRPMLYGAQTKMLPSHFSKEWLIDTFVCINVGDECWRRNMLVTTLRYWWRSRPFRSKTSTIFLHTRQAPKSKDVTKIEILSPTSNSFLSRQHYDITNITITAIPSVSKMVALLSKI